MRSTPEPFKTRTATALVDATLKIAIDRTTRTAEYKRASALSDFPEFEAARDRGRRIKDDVIANLDYYLVAAHIAAGLARSLLARGSGACLHAGRPWAVGL